MADIPHWPLVSFDADLTTGPPNVPGPGSVSLNSAARRHAVRSWSTQRGRQYELDQAQAGTATLELVDPLELFHPENTASPFNTGFNKILPYRPMRITALWPMGNPNRRNLINATNRQDPSFETPDNVDGWVIPGGGSVANSTVRAFDGNRSLQVTQTAPGPGAGPRRRYATLPGRTYTVSCHVWPPAGTAVLIRVIAKDGTTYVSQTSTVSDAWERLTVTWRSTDPLEMVEVYASRQSGTPSFWVDAVQLELGDVATPFTTAGPTLYDLYTGYIERYPLAYDNAGSRRVTSLTAVDALAILSRTEVVQSYQDTVLADSPSVYYPFTDTIPPGSPKIASAQLQSYVLASEKGGLQWAGETFLDGTSVLSVTQQNPYDPPRFGWTPPETARSHITEWNTRLGSFDLKTSGATLECWFRLVAGSCTIMQVATVTDGNMMEPTQTYFRLASPNGRLQIWMRDELSGSAAQNPGTSFLDLDPSGPAGYPDGEWHYFAVSWTSAARDKVMLTLNGAEAEYTFAPAFTPSWSINNIHLSVNTVQGEPLAQFGIAHWAFYSRDIGRAGRLRHYRRGIGYRGEVTGARVERLLSTYWDGPRRVAPGRLAMAEDYSYGGRMLLDVLQEIQESERGLCYVDRRGVVVFEDRHSRYDNPDPLWTFGENPPGATPTEYPYRDYAGDYDPTYAFSQANLSRPGNNNYPPRVNLLARGRYGQRILSQTLQCNTDFELEQAGVYYLERYGDPKIRIEKLTLDPAANPALWPVVLSLEIGQKVTVRRRSSAMSTSANYYIEQIAHQVNGDAGTWTVDLELSPVFVDSAWVVGDPVRGVLGETTTPIY